MSRSIVFFVVDVVVFTAFVSSHIFSHINSLPHFLCLLFKVACIRCSLERKKAELTKNPPPVFHSTYHQPTKPDNTCSLTYIHIYWLTAWTNAQRLSPSDTPQPVEQYTYTSSHTSHRPIGIPSVTARTVLHSRLLSAQKEVQANARKVIFLISDIVYASRDLLLYKTVNRVAGRDVLRVSFCVLSHPQTTPRPKGFGNQDII